MTADKTGAQTTVSAQDGKYTIAVEGETVGFADFADRGDERVFYHTVIDPAFGGRGLATILVEHALDAARADGKRIVPVCSMVANVIEKHPEFAELTDPVTPEIQPLGTDAAEQIGHRRRRGRRFARNNTDTFLLVFRCQARAWLLRFEDVRRVSTMSARAILASTDETSATTASPLS